MLLFPVLVQINLVAIFGKFTVFGIVSQHTLVYDTLSSSVLIVTLGLSLRFSPLYLVYSSIEKNRTRL